MEGIININKPKGISSFDVIRNLRKTLGERRLGHTGTLDPLATGVLVICAGRATKLASEIEAERKTYIAELELGYKTDTYDIEGKILDKKENFVVSQEKLETVIKKFVGKIDQIPPMYSAIKVDGKKLYELAREGKSIERKSRNVEIDYINIIEFDGLKALIECQVSKGTYIRSLIFDLGEELGTFATMTNLQRSKVGNYNVEESYTLEQIKEMMENNNMNFIKPVEETFVYPKIAVTDEKQKKLLTNGNTVKILGIKDGKYRLYFDDMFWGLGFSKKESVKPYKYFKIKK